MKINVKKTKVVCISCMGNNTLKIYVDGKWNKSDDLNIYVA